MAVTKSPRVGLTRWSEDTDPWSRDDWDDDNAAVEQLMAIDLQVDYIGNRPAAGTRGRFCWVRFDQTEPGGTDGSFQPAMYRDNGTAWVKVWPASNVPERAVIQFGPDAQNNPIDVPAVGWYPAGREMKFLYASGGGLDVNGDNAEELVGGDVGAGGANNYWRAYAPWWIDDIVDDPAAANPGVIRIDAKGLYEVEVVIALDTIPDGIWAAGIGSRTGQPVSTLAPIWMGHPLTVDAATRTVKGSSVFTVRAHATLVLDQLSTLELLPFLYFPSTSTSGGQRQFSTCTVSITRWPGN